MFHETIYPIHLAYTSNLPYNDDLFTFKLHWAPNWITGRPSNTAATTAAEKKKKVKI